MSDVPRSDACLIATAKSAAEIDQNEGEISNDSDSNNSHRLSESLVGILRSGWTSSV
jgi:hypothetical protein